MWHDKISFTKKQIQDLSADVLFSYTNKDFHPVSGGVYKTILDLDRNIEKECSAAKLSLGEAYISTAGSLPYKSICHFVVSGSGNDPTEISVRSAMRWGFQILSEVLRPNMTLPSTFVLPTLSSESGGMPGSLCAEIILREAIIFAENKFVQKIQVCSSSNKDYNQYLTAMKAMNKK